MINRNRELSSEQNIDKIALLAGTLRTGR